MGVGAVAGTKLYIAPPGIILANDASFVEVKNVATLGNIAAAFTKIMVSEIGVGDDYEIKGTRNFPDLRLHHQPQ